MVQTRINKKQDSGLDSKSGLQNIVEVPRKIAKDFHKEMGRTLFDDCYGAIIQGIDNAWDADATLVEIIFDPENSNLIIRDNGDGMDYSGIEDFLRFGGSIKKTEPYTPKGRLRHGDVGVGKSFMRYLGYASILNTIPKKKREKYTIEEAFVREIITDSLVKDDEVKEMPLKKQDKFIDEIINRVLNGESPNNITEITYLALINKVEKRYGPLEKILNKGEWKNVKVIINPTDGKSGTEISMSPLKFTEKKGVFEVSKLVNEIQKAYALQLGPLFRVKLNSVEVEPNIPKDAILYEVNGNLKLCGPVKGIIYYIPHRGVDQYMRGIHPVVGRTIGDGSFIDLYEISYRFITHMYGFVEVPELKSSLRFDKKHLRYDSEEFVELKKFLRNFLGKIKTDIERDEEKTKKERIRNILKEAEIWVKNRIEKKGFKSKGNIEIIDPSKSGPLETYDERTNTVYINKERRVLDDKNILFNLKSLLRDSCSRAFAKSEASKQLPGVDRLYEIIDEISFEEECDLLPDNSRTLAQIFAGVGDLKLENRPSMLQIFPLRLYTDVELEQKIGRDQLVFRRLAECGLIQERQSQRYRGDDVIEALEKIHGYKLLIEIIKEEFKRTSVTMFYRYEAMLQENIKRAGTGRMYLMNIGRTRPLYCVKEGFEDIFLTQYWHKEDKKPSEKKEESISFTRASQYIFEATSYRVQPEQLKRMSKDPEIKLELLSSQSSLRLLKKSDVDRLVPIIQKDKTFREKYQIVKC